MLIVKWWCDIHGSSVTVIIDKGGSNKCSKCNKEVRRITDNAVESWRR